MIKAEKNYKKYHGHRNVKSQLRVLFLSAHDYFDKLLRKSEREYNKNVVINIENMSKHNHRDFWRNITTNTDIVLNTWKNDFENCINLVLKTLMLP